MVDLNEVMRSLNLLHPEGGVRNLRILRHRGGMDSYWFGNTDRLGELIGTIDPDPDVKAIFIQLQEINRDNLNIQEGDGVKRSHIGRYIWFALDVDTLRPNKSTSNATDEEKVQSWETVKAIHRFLRGLGWPPAVICNSGNGWHLLWRIDLPFDPTLDKWDPSFLLVQKCLTALACKFNNDVAEVDESLAEPEQLIKVWGTWVRKAKASTDDRPWRQSRLVRVPEEIETVQRELLEKVAALCPEAKTASATSGPRKMRSVHADFDVYDFIEFFDKKLREAGYVGWSIKADEITKSDRRTYYPVDWCPTAQTEHSGDQMKSCIVVGETVGWNCFSDDCTDTGFYALHRALHDLTGFWYQGPIFADKGEDSWDVEMTGIDRLPGLEEPPASAYPPTITQPAESTIVPRERFGDNTAEQLAEAILNAILLDPTAVYRDYALYHRRLMGRVNQIEDDNLRLAYRYLAKYEAESKKLPNKGELIDFVTNHQANREESGDRKFSVVGYLQHLQIEDPSLTLDTTMQRFFHKADLRVEKKAWKKGFEILKGEEDIQKARQLVRKVWAASLACGGDHGFRPGAIQEKDHIEHLIESFRKDLAGANDERKFRTGFATIDTSSLNIGLDNEHAICIYGPSNNAKTSLALTLAYNFARNGKNGLIFVGEHQAEKVEKRLAIIHSDNFKDRFVVPGISAWESKEPARRPKLRDFENIQAVLRDLQAMKTVPGYLEVKNINSLGGTLDNVLSYLEATDQKYGWDFCVIDPFDSVVPDAGNDQKWQASTEAVQTVFDCTRDFRNGRGVLALVTAQMLSKSAREIEKLQTGEEEDLAGIREQLKQDKQIQLFTTLSQRFDLALGVALLRKNGRDGILVQGRSREGSDFDFLRFRLDPHCHIARDVCPERMMEHLDAREIA